METKNATAAVFLDRDGVINEGGKINRAADFKLLPHARSSLRRLKKAGLKTVVDTNQSGLGEALDGTRFWKGAPMTRAELAAIHDRMRRLLGPAATPDLIKFCPHSKSIECACRKPKAGMLLEAAAELNIDLSRSFQIGDMASDIEAGLAAGCTPILVLTGFDPKQQNKCPAGTIILPSIKEAVDFVLAEHARRAAEH